MKKFLDGVKERENSKETENIFDWIKDEFDKVILSLDEQKLKVLQEKIRNKRK